ncbi:zinc finger protein 431-like [Acanthaster planci]|uniref:Zinc finger protein 431-like n=1 Tax=Acanthaster planci TaxID=133434 RepID=A0A8B7ZYP3_ACAPL|nr:zinc finger protein 431-like [Acanthaster planci]
MEGYSCGHCREEFPTRLLLNQHNGDTHQIIQPKTRAVVFQCNFCPNKLTSQDELLEHVKTYHLSNIASTSSIGEPTAVHVKAKKPDKRKGRTKVFQCSYCHECFSKESRVTRHERIHTNEKPHVCHICGLAFTFKRELKQHLQKECKVGDADISEKKASFTGMDPEDLENATQDGSDDDDDVICIPSSPSPSPSPPTSIPALGSVHIQRLDPVPVIGQPPSSVAGQISTLDSVTPSVYSTSVALPPSRDQIYLIQYDQTQQGPVSITIPDQLSSAAIRILPTDQNKPSVPVPVRLERLISD